MSSPKKATGKKSGKAEKSDKGDKSKAGSKQSRSARAGITFPVGRIASLLKKGKYARRIGATTPVFIAAALEYLTVELVAAANTATKDLKKKRLTPRTINLGIRGDDELSNLLSDAVVSGGGVPPLINKVLLKSKKSKKRRKSKKSKKTEGGKKEKKEKKEKKKTSKKKSAKKSKKKSAKKSKSGEKKSAKKKTTKKSTKKATTKKAPASKSPSKKSKSPAKDAAK